MDATQAATNALLQVIDRLLVADAVGLIIFATIIYALIYALVRSLSRSTGGVVVTPPDTPPPVVVQPPDTGTPPVVAPAGQPELSIGSNGAAVTLLQQLLGITADGDFGSDTDAAVRAYQATHGIDVDGDVGPDTWAALLTNKPAVAQPTGVAISSDTINKILQAAAASNLAHYAWADRGVAPAAYINGMAVSFANAYAKWKQGSSATAVMAQAATGDGSTDALSWYSAFFSKLNMSNSAAGADTLRHTFVLLTGLGMRESSGIYCTGRDTSANNETADTAEAGLFQQSWNSRSASPELPKLFAQYSANPEGFKSIFSDGVSCSASNLQNYGSGDGQAFQALCKSCPDFAVECAAVGLRVIRQHWGPINRQEAEVRPEADQLFQQVQQIVDTAPVATAPAVPAAQNAPVVTAPLTGAPWVALGRTYVDNVVWSTGPMPSQIVAWLDAVVAKFPEEHAYVQTCKNEGATKWWPWCGLYVRCMLAPFGIKGPLSAAGLAGAMTVNDWSYVDSWLGWGTKVWDASDGPVSNAQPQTGDVLIWNAPGIHHVSIYGKVLPDTNTFDSLGGDQGKPLRVCEEGLQMSWCVAIRRPPAPTA